MLLNIKDIKTEKIEEDYICINAKVLDIDIVEIKDKISIFTLKVTDETDSMCVKIFSRIDEEMDAIKKLVKIGKWFSFAGRSRINSYSNDELVFLTKYKNIVELEDKKAI